MALFGRPHVFGSPELGCIYEGMDLVSFSFAPFCGRSYGAPLVLQSAVFLSPIPESSWVWRSLQVNKRRRRG